MANILTKGNVKNHYHSIPFMFNETTTGKTYFRNCDDLYNAWEWDSNDSEDSTTLGDTISLTSMNYLSGYVVPVDMVLEGAQFSAYQSQASNQTMHFQLWTGQIVGGTFTLRTTDEKTSNRAALAWTTNNPSTVLDAGKFIVLGLQKDSLGSNTWFGSCTLKLREV